MASPVYLDGPLHNQVHEVPDDLIEQGIYRYGTQQHEIYTFTLVHMYGQEVIVASTGTTIPADQLLFDHLASDAAKRAAGRS